MRAQRKSEEALGLQSCRKTLDLNKLPNKAWGFSKRNPKLNLYPTKPN